MQKVETCDDESVENYDHDKKSPIGDHVNGFKKDRLPIDTDVFIDLSSIADRNINNNVFRNSEPLHDCQDIVNYSRTSDYYNNQDHLDNFRPFRTKISMNTNIKNNFEGAQLAGLR